MAGLDTGTLDRRIAILRAASDDDGFSTIEGAFASVGTRWASKRDASDAERRTAAEQGAEVTSRFVVRWDDLTATITPKDRLMHNNTVYTISGVKEIGRRDGREITAAARIDIPPIVTP